MIIIKDTNDKRILINIGHITHMKEGSGFVLIFLQCGDVLKTGEAWEELILKIKSIGATK